MKLCSIKDCSSKNYSKSFCIKHYVRFRKHGNPDVVLKEKGKRTIDGLCSIDGCTREFSCRGFCSMHYVRFKIHGDPNKSLIPQEKGPLNGLCIEPDCGKKHHSRKYCSNHLKQKYPEENRAHCAKRRAMKLRQTPPWVNNEELKAKYRDVPKGYHIDHIIPLKGLHVRGLHVPENLRAIPGLENETKGNRIDLNDPSLKNIIGLYPYGKTNK